MANKHKRGLIVEDESVVGGEDAQTGAPVIRPKTPDGQADESVIPTDPREAANKAASRSRTINIT
jgi:hypothetical protein